MATKNVTWNETFCIFFILFNRPLIYFNVKLCFFSSTDMLDSLSCLRLLPTAHLTFCHMLRWGTYPLDLADPLVSQGLPSFSTERHTWTKKVLCAPWFDRRVYTHGGTGIAMRQWASMWSDYCAPIILIHSLHSKTLWVDDGGRATKILVYRSRDFILPRFLQIALCTAHRRPPVNPSPSISWVGM
jgi:hypothetical protein